MASAVAAKSQPRLNLKWPMNQSNTQRYQTHLSPSPGPEKQSASPLKSDHRRSSGKHGDSSQSPLCRAAPSSMAENEHRYIKISYPTLYSSWSANSKHDDRDHRVNNDVKSGISKENLIEREEKSANTVPIEGLEKKVASTTFIVEKKELNSDGKSKILIRIPARIKGAVDETQCAVEDDEPMAKTWNLRPRRAVTKPPHANGSAPENKPRSQSRPELAATRAAPEEKAAKKRQMFSISLSKEEIEEDFLGMTGSRPPRKPKRRARTVQKQLDEIFPGLWLTNVTADLYRVTAHLKG
ncbi:hypothetical protein L6164_000672 [Bauhinia variegata]|uniref:Uncharacterized protein n=1 Tax=Bauhinia variegata TaxID=167791 RepID=A0ACB9Q7B1_BAUVA|nr:hypothetical protein L6164_000672 [Bauhinia variegata]